MFDAVLWWTQWDAWIVGVSLLTAALLTRVMSGRFYRRSDRRAFQIAVGTAAVMMGAAAWLLRPWADYGDGMPGVWSAGAVLLVAWYAVDLWRFTRGLPPLGGWLIPHRWRDK